MHELVIKIELFYTSGYTGMCKLFIMEFDVLECASRNEGGCQHLAVRQICEVGMTRREVVFRKF